jgi:2-oxoglutarate ferredoxin oxidoreductase subunit gamma
MKEIMFAGIGGQGVILSASILARAGILKGYYAAQSQSYGSESRGTATRAEVVLSEEFVDFPHVEHADIFVVMAEMGVKLFASKVSQEAIVLYDNSVFELSENIGKERIGIPATRLSVDTFKKPLYANIIMLGAMMRHCGMVGPEEIKAVLKETVPPKALADNIKALELGSGLSL